MYHFLSGYTAKVAGTERGMGSQPQATFSACFGAPFMTLHPRVYAELLGERISTHNSTVWLVNTGWTSGPYGVGHRMSIKHTRALLTAALTGELDDVPTTTDPIFGFQVPDRCPGLPKDILKPRLTWHDHDAYDLQAQNLAGMFIDNFKGVADAADTDILRGAPRLLQAV
jgi:phosphoenolpyruvate carboxykinase (ATP)